jgi:hypothetical protein
VSLKGFAGSKSNGRGPIVGNPDCYPETGMWEATVIPSANGDALKAYGGGRESAPQDDYPHPYQNPRLCVRDYSVGHHGSPGAFWTPIPRAIRVDEPAGLDKTERHVGRTN